MARSFNGSSDIASTSNNAGQNITGAQSQSCWVLFNANNVRQDCFSSWNVLNTGAENWLLSLLGAGPTIQYFLSPDGVTADGVDSTVAPATSTWYNVVGTWDGTTQTVYVTPAGGSTTTKTATPTIASVMTSSQGIGFAYTFDTGGTKQHFLNGNLADCAIWNVTLASGDVTKLVNGVRPASVQAAHLVGWWPLDGYASPESELSGAGNTATLTGTARVIGPPPLWRISG